MGGSSFSKLLAQGTQGAMRFSVIWCNLGHFLSHSGSLRSRGSSFNHYGRARPAPFSLHRGRPRAYVLSAAWESMSALESEPTSPAPPWEFFVPRHGSTAEECA